MSCQLFSSTYFCNFGNRRNRPCGVVGVGGIDPVVGG